MDNTFTKSQNQFLFTKVVPQIWGNNLKQLRTQDNISNESSNNTKNYPQNETTEITYLHNKLDLLITKINTLSSELNNNSYNYTTYVDSNIPKIKNLFLSDNLHVRVLKEYIKNNIIRCHNDHRMTMVAVADIIDDMSPAYISCNCKECNRVNTYYYNSEHILSCIECSLFICPTVACVKANKLQCEKLEA
jgi:ribosomal protein S27E